MKFKCSNEKISLVRTLHSSYIFLVTFFMLRSEDFDYQQSNITLLKAQLKVKDYC